MRFRLVVAARLSGSTIETAQEVTGDPDSKAAAPEDNATETSSGE